MEDLGDRDLALEIREGGLTEPLVARVTTLFSLLRALSLVHGDTKASNFLAFANEVHLIDLDGMRASARGADQDLKRFLDNWSGEVLETFVAAFQRAGLLP